MTAAPLSIVHVAAPAPVGGLERVVQALAIGQHRAGHRVQVIAVIGPDPAEHPFVAPLRAAGVTVQEVRLPTRAYWRERRLVQSLVRAARADVVHLHGARNDLLHAGPVRRTGAAVVSTAHGSSRFGGRSDFVETIQLRAWRRFDAVVAVSGALQASLVASGVPASRVRCIVNAWPGREPSMPREAARHALGVDPTKFTIGFVGRLIHAKGPDVLAAALAALTDLPWQAVIIGDGREREALTATLADRGLAERITMAGHVDDATPLFTAFDAFVLSSRTEGTPIVLFEAMAAALPIVATRVGGVPDMLDETQAWLVPSERPEAMAEALRAVMADAPDATARGRAARQRLEREFSTEAWVEAHVALYRELRPATVR